MRFLAILLLPMVLACGRSSSGPSRSSSQENLEEKAPYDCNFKGVQSLSVPLYPDQNESPTFEYKYQIVGDYKPSDWLVVYIPGGPGRSSMNDYGNSTVLDDITWHGLPKNKPYLFIDPRTVGCNWGDVKTFPDDSLKSEYLASDILAVLKHLKVEKYVIFGHSYGSQSATFLASQAEAGEGPRPSALLLSGVLGLGKADGSFAVKEQFKLEWELLKKNLSPETLSLLSQGDLFGYEEWIWTSFIATGLKVGKVFLDGDPKTFENPFVLRLESIKDGGSKNLRRRLDLIRSPEKAPGHYHRSSRLFEKIDCHEFSPDDRGYNFIRGEFQDDLNDIGCEDEAFDRPYDSAKLLTSAPIYYIAGTNDPAAPFEGALYHFQHQSKSRRNFIELEGAGHVVMGQVLWDCEDELWSSIFKLEDWTEALKACAVPHKHSVAPPI